MASNSAMEARVGAPGNVLEVQVGTIRVDVPRSVGYFGGLAVAVGVGLIEPPLAVFIAAVPVFKALTNSALPRLVRVVGELLEGAAKPVGNDAGAWYNSRTNSTPPQRPSNSIRRPPSDGRRPDARHIEHLCRGTGHPKVNVDQRGGCSRWGSH